MRLDLLRLVPVRRGRLDHVRVDRPLHEEFRLPELFRLRLEDADELLADDPPLLLRFGHAVQRGEKIRQRPLR
jgi:hypothetical protein